MEKIKVILIFKFILLMILFGVYSGKIFVGDKPVEAQQGGQTPASPSTEVSANLKNPENAQNEKASSRQGYLDSLLEMPTLNTSNLSKEEIGKYLNLAEIAKQQVENRMSALKKKSEELKNIEKTIDTKLEELEKERLYITKTLQREKEIKEDRLTTLVELYVKMEPKKAASVMESMDQDLLVALFQKMKRKQVTAILEAMDPEVSKKITEYFGRVRSGREYEILRELNQSLRNAFEDCKGLATKV